MLLIGFFGRDDTHFFVYMSPHTFAVGIKLFDKIVFFTAGEAFRLKVVAGFGAGERAGDDLSCG